MFLKGFGDARADDESRFAAAIQRAFRDSSELWLENAPPEALANRYPATKAQAVVLFQELSHESDGRTFFDELEPEIRQRTLTYMTELDIKQESVENVAPLVGLLHPQWTWLNQPDNHRIQENV
ncbi:MAG: hypothetical protein WBX22_20135 [Silvibacterium sp.]